MIELRLAREDELETFDAMDRQAHASRYVIQTGIVAHRENFANPDILYLSIERDGELCGYFILVLEADGDSIEFRRILIDQRQRGVGQAAIGKMEEYCRRRWNPKRIWLDVYEDNEIGRHIYPKLGYEPFEREGSDPCGDGRRLLFFEKRLRPD